MPLVRYYKLDGNANDALGANNGTITGTVTSTAGKIDTAMQVSADNNGIETPDVSSFINNTDPFSVTCIIKPSTTTDNKEILGNSQVNRTRFTLTRNGSNYISSIIIGGSAGLTGINSLNDGEIPTTAGINKYSFISVTFDGNDFMQLWVNGNYFSGTGSSLSGTVSTQTMRLFDDVSTFTATFKGKMDEVRFYDEELSIGFAKTLYSYYIGIF